MYRRNLAFSVGIGFLLVIMTLLSLLLVATPQTMASGEDGTRDNLTVQAMAVTGVAQSLAAASGDGQKFTNTGDTFVIVKNDYTATITATFVTPGQVAGLDIEDVDVAVGAGATKLVGPFLIGVFNQDTGTDKNKVYLNWNTAVTGTVADSVTLQVFDLD